MFHTALLKQVRKRFTVIDELESIKLIEYKLRIGIFNHQKFFKLLKSLFSVGFTSMDRHPQRETFENFSAFETLLWVMCLSS